MKRLEELGIELKRNNSYPWRIFWRVVISQILLYNFLILFISVLFLDSNNIQSSLIKAFFWYFFGSVILSIANAYYFCRPVARIIHKVLVLSSKKKARDLGPLVENLTDSEVGEYSQIENALDRIDRKIRKNQDRLKREKDVVDALMSGVQDGLVSVDLEGRLLFFNSQFATHFLTKDKLKRTI